MSRPQALRWSEVTALFGGTFDPPHVGHRIAIQGLFSAPGVGRVLVLPTPTPPHKPAVATAEQRVDLARLAFNGFSGPVELDLREIRRAGRTGGTPTYTFDTLTELRREIPRLAFVLGTDQLEKFHTWHRFPEVLGLAHWIVLERKSPSLQPDTAHQILRQWEASGLVRREGEAWKTRDFADGLGGTSLKIVPTAAPALSSTQVRETIARTGRPPEGALLPTVEAYLMEHRIYGTGKQSGV